MFGAQDLSGGEDGRFRCLAIHTTLDRAGLLWFQEHPFRRGHQSCTDIGKVCRIIDVAVDDPCDIHRVKGGALIAKLSEERLWIGKQPGGHFAPARQIGRCKIHLDALAHHRRLSGSQMPLGNPVKSLFGMGTTVKADVTASKCQIPAGRLCPGDLPRLHCLPVARPDCVDDPALRLVPCRHTQWLSVIAGDRHDLEAEPLRCQGPERCQNMYMRITVPVVINPVGDHAPCGQLVSHELTDQGHVFLKRQFLRQSNNQFTGKLCVHTRLKCVNRIPQCLACRSHRFPLDSGLQPRWNIFRQRQFFMDQIIVAAAIVKQGSGLFVSHPSAMAIGGSRDDVASRSPADHLCSHEHDCHNVLLAVSQYV